MHPRKWIIQNAYVLLHDKAVPEKQDMLIEEGIIIGIAPSLSQEGIPVFDAKDMIVLPGLVDLTAHICQNFEEVETAITKGSKAAVKGGFTSICVMPDSNPPIDNEGMVNLIQMLADKISLVKLLPTACVTKGLMGKELSELGSLMEAGAVALYDANRSIESSLTQRRLFEYSKLFKAPLLVHCEDKILTDLGMFHEGSVSTQLGLPGFPSVSEEIIVARDILLSEYTKRPVHVCHITSEQSVELIRQAKLRGVNVTASVTPHHLDLTDEDMKEFDSHFKIFPPLRSQSDRQALIDGVKSGVIDLISSDHTPCTPHEKEVEFHIARQGTVSLQTAFQVCYERLVHSGHLSLKELSHKMSVAPLRLLHKEGGEIKLNVIADLMIIDTGSPETKTLESFGFSYVNSPYIGRTFSLKVKATVVNGFIRYIKGMEPFDTGSKCLKES